MVSYGLGMVSNRLVMGLVLLLTSAAVWAARGVYDEHFMDDGVFHVVNAADERRTIELAFRSGERRAVTLDAGQAASVRVEDTGEGAVSVTAGSEFLGDVGYVSSQNDLSLIVVLQDRALFSTYLRRRPPTP